MEDNKEYKVPKNVVPLLSKGKLYKDNISVVEIEYMTAYDEDLLSTTSILKSGKVMDVLLERKMLTKELKPSDLIIGDKNRILLQLRADSYGQFYNVTVTCPFTGKNFEDSVDLVKLKLNELEVEPNEELLFPFTLPLSKDLVEFKLLTSGESDAIMESLAMNKTPNGVETKITSTLRMCIKKINGNPDKANIQKYVTYMRAGDSLALRSYIEKISPRVDNSYEMLSPYTDEKFMAKVSFGSDFFYPGI